jgi:hypothetical protein
LIMSWVIFPLCFGARVSYEVPQNDASG